jgi:hypothetical protein
MPARMQNTIVIHFRGNALIVSWAVANSLNLKNGQEIRTESHFWDILAANASHMLSICEHALETKPN